MKRFITALLSVLIIFTLVCCGANEPKIPNPASDDPSSESGVSEDEQERASIVRMNVIIGEKTFTAELSDNSSADALVELLKNGPLSIDMHDYGNFEKVGSIGQTLPRNDERITTGPGDIILYQGDQIVLYYDTNTWEFTSIGHIPNVTTEELLAVLGKGDVTVQFSLNDEYKEETKMAKKITQTAGRNALGEFAPEFAHYNDDVLFGENWNNLDIDLKTRSIITVVALMSSGITDSSLKYHLQNAKSHGVSHKEIAAIITHVGFYAGWPKAWAVFNMAKEIWALNEGDLPYEDAQMRAHAKEMVFPIGAPNDAYAAYFSGKSFLAPISTDQVGIHNVTFEPACRNNWHIHHAKSGGGQILICIAGEGWYQEEGKAAIAMKPGDCVNIPAGVKHWHGAAADSWFSHLAIEVPGEACANEWCEPVTDEAYAKLSRN